MGWGLWIGGLGGFLINKVFKKKVVSLKEAILTC